jgi:plasmid stabilization system protein ParE
MRRAVYAASFIDDADAIVSYIETMFSSDRADLFREELDHFCEVLAALPGRGKGNHGYDTPLLGVVFERNWIFFRLDETEARFVHIVAARRRKSAIRF